MAAVSPSSPTGYLHNLCRQGNVTAIRPFLQGIVDTRQLEERVGFLGYTPLHEATNRGQTSVVKLLLLYGADPNAKANGFYTPLHIAASMDNVHCVEELLGHGADISCKDEFGKSPYETAVIHRCKKAARILKSEEVKKAARENSPNIREMLKSVKTQDVLPSCFREALWEASRVGNMGAVCAIIITGARHSLKLKDCIIEALTFSFLKTAAMLLVCYAAKHDKMHLLRYLMGMEMSREEEQQALLELSHDIHDHSQLPEIRSYISDRDTFNIAVPIGLALQQKKKKSVEILLLSTDCNQEQKKVDWQKLALGEIDPSWLDRIKWVEKLSLASNLLTSLPSNIAVLTKLCRMDLRRNQLKSVPVELLQMPGLRELNLSENRIYDLPKKCAWTLSLKTLYLNDNFLETLPKSMGMAKLFNLYVARNNLYEVPVCICELLTLQTLDLSGNPRLTQLPLQMGRLTEISTLKLDNLDQVTDPPEEIKRNGVKTLMYLRDKLRASQGYYTIKLMLVGRADQGKTTLMHRLMRDYSYNTNSPTNGIAMDEFRFRKDMFHRDYIFKIWDFGGQEDFYTTHQCFLSTLALYLLVWNLEEGESGIEMLKSWLDTICASASNTSLIIVGTHLDKVRKDKDVGYQERMRDLVKELVMSPKYNRIYIKDIKEVSCAPDNREGIDDLRIAIYDVAAGLQKGGVNPISVMGEMIPHSFLSVADVIQAKREELRNAGRMPIMHKSEYEALVLDTIKNDAYDIEDSNDLRVVTQFMHERGILMHYNDPNQDLQDLYFIDPKWLCELMAQIVTLPEVNPFIHDGILVLDRTSLPFIFKGERFPQQNYSQFIRLLNRFQIACSLDDERVLIPSKLPIQRPDEATNSDLHYITLKRIHSLPSIPHGFWSRLISRVLFYTKDMLSGGENYDREKYSSPFQLDPFCCRCPLIVDTPASAEPSASTAENDERPRCQTGESVTGTSFENLLDVPDGFRGITRFFNEESLPRRGGLFVNGIFFGSAEFGSGSLHSDSGFEYSSGDEEEERSTAQAGVWPSREMAGAARYPRRDPARFKYGTDPGVRSGERAVDLDFGTPKSDSAVPVLRKAHANLSLEDVDVPYVNPDGRWDVDVLQARSDGRGDVDVLHASSDGTGAVAIPQATSNGTVDVPHMSPDGTGAVDVPQASTDGSGEEDVPQRSPDGTRVAVVPQASSNGTAEVPHMSSDGRGAVNVPQAISNSITDVPRRSPDGSEDVPQMSPEVAEGIGLPANKPPPTLVGERIEAEGSLQREELAICETRDGKDAVTNATDCQMRDNKTLVFDKKEINSRECNGEFELPSDDVCGVPCHPKSRPCLSNQSLEESWSEEARNSDEKFVLQDGSTADGWDLQSGHSFTSSVFSSISTEQESSGDGIQSAWSPASSTDQTTSSEEKPTPNDKSSIPQEKRDVRNAQEVGIDNDCSSSVDSRFAMTPVQDDPSSWTSQENDSPTSQETPSFGGTALMPDPDRSMTSEDNKDPPRSRTPHLPCCPFREDFPIESLPALPSDLPTLLDNLFLRCWQSGVCLRHPRLFFLVYCTPDPNSDRQLIVIEASPCPQGRRVLSYMVDHIDTLIREWYPEFTATDGSRPKARQLIPCIVCERLGLEPHKFTFAQCQLQSAESDTISCPKHSQLVVNLHHVAPDIMLHDVDADLLLRQDEIKYENSDASTLGSGGFGKVVRGVCRGQAVAIKFYNQSDESDPLRHYREARKELNVLRRVRQHPFLINIIGVSLRPLCLVLELAERGALTEIFITPMAVHRVVLFRIAYQVADALRFLHNMGVIYRDLKPENVLLWSLDERDDLHVKLIDFGTANFATSVGLISCKGSRGNHAPEMLQCANKEEYTSQVDVYSFGILLFQLITRLPPFDEIDSEPRVNTAVIAGDRPKWRHVPRTMFGLPTLTELMLRCWAAKPTKRPTSAQIAEQIRQPAFQCLIGKQAIPSQQSVRHACLVPDLHELWLACDDHTGNRILVYDGRTLDLKFSFSIDSDQEQSDACQIQCVHCTAPYVLIAVRGGADLIKAYSISSATRYKCVASMSFNEQISCITSNEEHIFVGLNEGRFRCILRTDMKKSDKKRTCRVVKEGHHRILSLVVARDKLWMSSSKYIFRFFTKAGDVDAFELESMWYGGPEGMENNPQTQISLLRVTFDKQSVLSVCRSVLCSWDADSRQKLFSLDCAPVIRQLTAGSSRQEQRVQSDAEACITSVEPTSDSLWVATASGFILIFDDEKPRLLTWFHAFDEVRTLTMAIGPGPCGTEQCYVISTGKRLRKDGLGAVCVLSNERVREPPQEEPDRKVSDVGRKRTLRRTLSGRKLKSPSFEEQEKAAMEVHSSPQSKCSMIMWEVVSKNSFARVEAKSGRQRFLFGSEIQVADEGASPENDEQS